MADVLPVHTIPVWMGEEPQVLLWEGRNRPGSSGKAEKGGARNQVQGHMEEGSRDSTWEHRPERGQRRQEAVHWQCAPEREAP